MLELYGRLIKMGKKACKGAAKLKLKPDMKKIFLIYVNVRSKMNNIQLDRVSGRGYDSEKFVDI